jgi:protein involved in polysaccharide export with SLBB domain
MRKLCVSSLIALSATFTGCQTLENSNGGVAAPEVTVSKTTTVTNGMLAQTMIRLRDMEGIIKNINDQKLCIKELQRIQIWPKGNFNAAETLSAKTFLQVEALLKAQKQNAAIRDATIERGSEVTVRVYDIGVGPDDVIEKTTNVDKNGDITLPMVRKVNINGLTDSDAAEKIRKAYINGGFFRDCTVDVTGETGSLYIVGEIKTPGRVDFKGGMTLTELIISSGGLNEFANRDAIKIIRNQKTSKHDYDEIQKGEEVDPILKPGDRVIVERRWM